MNTEPSNCQETQGKPTPIRINSVRPSRFPSPQPSPQGEGAHVDSTERVAEPSIIRAVEAGSPSPWGEGWGEIAPRKRAHCAPGPWTETEAAMRAPSPRGEGRGEGDRGVRQPSPLRNEAHPQ